MASAAAPGSKRNKLNDLWQKLGDIRYMDPACGCGNFIIVAYRELRALELQIMDAIANLSAGEGSRTLEYDWTILLKVTLDHFYGIEVDEWPARIAETAMFLMDRQCDLKMRERFGVAPQRLPIQKSAKIAVGSALAIAWEDELRPSKNVVVVGNPPFLGISLRSASQTAELKEVWGDRYHGTLDYVTGWHARALAYFGKISGKWAFVTTNSITRRSGRSPVSADPGCRLARSSSRTEPLNGRRRHRAKLLSTASLLVSSAYPEVKRLFDYDSIDGAPVEVRGIKNITPYLTDG